MVAELAGAVGRQAWTEAEHESVLTAVRSGDAARIGAVVADHMDAAVATLVTRLR